MANDSVSSGIKIAEYVLSIFNFITKLWKEESSESNDGDNKDEVDEIKKELEQLKIIAMKPQNEYKELTAFGISRMIQAISRTCGREADQKINYWNKVLVVTGAKGAGKSTFLHDVFEIGDAPVKSNIEGTTQLKFLHHKSGLLIVDTIGCAPTLRNLIKVIAACIFHGYIPSDIIIVDQSRPVQYDEIACWLRCQRINILSYDPKSYHKVKKNDSKISLFSFVDEEESKSVNDSCRYLHAMTNPEFRSAYYAIKLFGLYYNNNSLRKDIEYNEYLKILAQGEGNGYDLLLRNALNNYMNDYSNSQSFNEYINKGF
jgi:hypothetical protein